MDDNVTVETLSYKELQGLAMSLSLPGKMKSGVLVEAIKARQSNNEQAVAAILEANRQRRIVRRQQQQQLQHKQLLKHENGIRKCITTRSRFKRSASEMELTPLVIDEECTVEKRSKLAAALQQPRRPVAQLYYPAPTQRAKGVQQQQELIPISVAAWDQPHQNIPIAVAPVSVAPVAVLPDLSKELAALPTFSDSGSSVSSVSSVSSSCWGSLEPQAQPQCSSSFLSQGFDDSGWMGSEESYDLNTWKSMPNIKLQENYELNTPPPANLIPSGYFEEDIFGAPPYRPEELINHVQPVSVYSPPADDSTYLDLNRTEWCPEASPQQEFQEPITPSPSPPIQPLECRLLTSSLCDYAAVVPDHGLVFRVQRPGNPSPVFSFSGSRGLILPTFSLTLPRVASYVQ